MFCLFSISSVSYTPNIIGFAGLLEGGHKVDNIRNIVESESGVTRCSERRKSQYKCQEKLQMLLLNNIFNLMRFQIFFPQSCK